MSAGSELYPRVEEESRAYEELKPRLAALWKEVFPRDDLAYTSVIVPSVTVEAEALARHSEALYYEEALLFLLIRLRNPRSRVVYVTSRPLPQAVIDYYLQFLAGIPLSHAAARLTLLSAYDGSPRPLTEKILERPRLVEKIKSSITSLDRAYLTVFRSTPLERRLALRLGIPLNAADPEMEGLLGKSGARRVLREAGIEVPAGGEDLRDEGDLIEALSELRRNRPRVKRALIKLDHSHWDEGDAVLVFPTSDSRSALQEALRAMALPVAGENVDAYLARFARGRGVVEEFEENVIAVASGQVRINPRGQTSLTSTHDEIRGGPNGLASDGCRFPAADAYRIPVQDQALAVGRVLAAKGLVSRLSVQFMVLPAVGTPGFRLAASEFNLGVGGTTHPLLAVRFLSEGALDPGTGLFTTPTGRAQFYRATDHLRSERYRGLGPEDLIDIATMNGLNYSHQTESGVLFYMLGALSEHGRVGMVAIGNSREDADAVYGSARDTLDREARSGASAGI